MASRTYYCFLKCCSIGAVLFIACSGLTCAVAQASVRIFCLWSTDLFPNLKHKNKLYNPRLPYLHAQCNLLTFCCINVLLQAQDYNRSGNYNSAKQCGYMALGCNIAVIAWYVVEWIIAIIVIAVVYTSAAAAVSSSCRYTCGYYRYTYTCTYRCY